VDIFRKYLRLALHGEPTPYEDFVPFRYSGFSDDELLAECAKRRKQLDVLATHPGVSPAVGQILVSMDYEVERMTDELVRRLNSRTLP